MAHVCIITPSGMVCSSSPLKQHFHGSNSCDASYRWPKRQQDKAKKLKRKLAETRGEFSRDEQELIGRVVDLMLAVRIKKGRHFTIVHSR
jgi:hypothetical protein